MHPDDIRTKAGQELFNRVNMIYGSHVWGEVLRGIIEIEREAMITCCKANVIHNIYPDGLPVPEHMMDPNIGGWHKSEPQDTDWENEGGSPFEPYGERLKYMEENGI